MLKWWLNDGLLVLTWWFVVVQWCLMVCDGSCLLFHGWLTANDDELMVHWCLTLVNGLVHQCAPDQTSWFTDTAWRTLNQFWSCRMGLFIMASYKRSFIYRPAAIWFRGIKHWNSNHTSCNYLPTSIFTNQLQLFLVLATPGDDYLIDKHPLGWVTTTNQMVISEFNALCFAFDLCAHIFCVLLFERKLCTCVHVWNIHL